jgi:glycosyltransferase involved in cell wall biosynthesis
LGNAEARNFGCRVAKGAWIAFLDDDDEWYPEKLTQQLETAQQSPYLYPVISTYMIANNGMRQLLWPRRLPKVDEPLCEYLFCRNSFSSGEGVVQTSTLFIPKKLFELVAFNKNIRRYSDLDWLLRAAQVDGFGLHFVQDRTPLVTWNIEDDRPRIGNWSNWRYGLRWIRDRRQLVTHRAYAAFLIHFVGASAAQDNDWRAFFPLLQEAYKTKSLKAKDLISHIANFVIPRSMQHRLAGILSRRYGNVEV